MSFFGSIGSAIKNGVVGAGHLLGKVASNPIVDTAAGIFGGPLAGAALGGIGRLIAPGGNLGNAATGALQGGAEGLLGGGIRRLGSGVLGATGTFGRGPIMDGNGIDGQGMANDPFGDSIGLTHGGGGGGGLGGLISGAARMLGGGQGAGGLFGGGLGNLAMGGLAGYQALNAANASKRAGQLSDKALGLAESRWNDAAPLRSAGTARLLTPARPDLSGVYTDPSNPFASRPRRLGPLGGM